VHLFQSLHLLQQQHTKVLIVSPHCQGAVKGSRQQPARPVDSVVFAPIGKGLATASPESEFIMGTGGATKTAAAAAAAPAAADILQPLSLHWHPPHQVCVAEVPAAAPSAGILPQRHNFLQACFPIAAFRPQQTPAVALPQVTVWPHT